jgi:anti-sigma factor RsiW
MDELLQRFIDGDLTPEEAARAREILGADPQLRRDAQAYRRLGDLIREAAGTDALQGDADEAWKRVSEGLGGEPARDEGPSVARVWLAEVVNHRKRYWIPAAGAALAAAATLLVVLSVEEVPEVPVQVEQAVELRSRVTDISLNSASTMVIEVETGAGGTAAVLWVTGEDEETEEEEALDDPSE